MKVLIKVVGKFKYLENGDEKIEVEVDLLELHNSDFTIAEVITEKFEEINKGGCSCTFRESQNHCDCDGYGYEYDYLLCGIIAIETIKDY